MLVIVAGVYVAIRRNQTVMLPAPGGTYPVGRFITEWTDASRPETLGGTPGHSRALSVWIWYPAERVGSTVPYMPPDWVHARDASRGIGALLFQTVSAIHDRATDAPPSSAGALFPVLIMEPGLGPIIPEYATLAEDLASRGYVVIGLNPTYSAAFTVLDGQVVQGSPRGTIPEKATPEQAQQLGDALVAIWAADDRFAIDQAIHMDRDPGSPFAGHLDMQHVGLLGHSFGGAAAFEACSLDTRCSATADLDGWLFGRVIQAGLDRPALLISSEAGAIANTPAGQQAAHDFASVFARTPASYQVTILGTRHFNFTDSAIGFHPLEHLLGVLGSIDGARGLRIASEYLAGFFDQTLKNHPSPLLANPSPDYPEVQVTAH